MLNRSITPIIVLPALLASAGIALSQAWLANPATTVLLSIAFLALASGTSWWWLTRRQQQLERELQQLRNYAHRIADHDYPKTPSTSPGTSLRSIEDALSRVQAYLRSSDRRLQEEVNETTADLQQTVESLELKQAELDFSRRNALAANEAKNDFLASISHQVRTPLGGIIGFAELLLETSLDSEQRRFAGNINDSANTLLKVIDDILDFTKLESGFSQLTIAPFDLRDTVDACLTSVTPLAHAKRLDLILLFYNDVPHHVLGDRQRVQQILLNLLSNAIKFTEHGEVSIRIMLEDLLDDQVALVLSVNDTGTGIPISERANLLIPFRGENTSHHGQISGSGLGLTICQQLAEAMHGDIKIHSKPGAGTSVQVSIKLGISDATPNSQLIRLERAKITLIDEHPLARIATRNTLNELRAKVTVREALQDFEPMTESSQLIVLGIKASEIDHSETRISYLASRLQQPLLALISTSNPQRLRDLRLAGADAVLSRPVTPATLALTIQGLLRGATPPLPSFKQSPPPAPTDKSQWLAAQQILVADDDPSSRELMRTLLIHLGADVTTRDNGKDARDIALRQHFELVFLDIHMPHYNGAEVCAAIRAQAGPNQTKPIIAMSADASDNNRLLEQQSQFSTFLIKPINAMKLRQTLVDLLELPPQHPLSLYVMNSATPDSQAETQPPLVRNLEEALAIAGNNRDIADTLFLEFKKTLEDHLTQIQTALDQADWEALWQTVHKLKGSTSVCALTEMHHIVIALQKDIKDQDSAACEASITRLRAAGARAMAHDPSSD